MIQNKEWKSVKIKGQCTQYIISNYGDIINTNTGHLISKYLKDGFMCASLTVNNKHKSYNIALLELCSFKGMEKKDGLILYFKDDNRTNLFIENITLLTPEELYDENVKTLFRKKDGNYILKNGNENNEIWKRLFVDNTPTFYAISSNGRIINTITSFFLTPTIGESSPYPFVTIKVGSKSKKLTLHRIVAKLFVENTDPITKNIVNHKNENKSDYRAENLEWCTYSENVRYSLLSGKNTNIGEGSNFAVLNTETVIKICEMLESGYRVCSIVEILGVTRDQVRHIKNRTSWSHISKNYNFSTNYKFYVDDMETKTIIKLYESGKTYSEISELTKRGTTTIGEIIKKYKEKSNPNIITDNIQKRVDSSIINLHNLGFSIDKISELTGIKTEKVTNVLYYINSVD